MPTREGWAGGTGGQMPSFQPEQQWLHTTAKITERLCSLPAVANPDWCDDVARCYLPLADRGVVAVIVATIGSQGAVEEREAVGAAIDGPPELGGDGHIPNLVRSRADRLQSLGFAITGDALERGFCGSAERFSLPRDWRAAPLGRMWAEVATGELLIGGVPISPRTSGRMVLTMIARPDASTGLAGREGVLMATMPVLGRRAAIALGQERTTSGDWLTSREQLVLEQLTLGLTVADIAEETGRSAHTVHDHVKSLHKKLHASSRGELIARALGHITEIKPKAAKRKRGGSESTEAEGQSRVEEVKPGARRVSAHED